MRTPAAYLFFGALRAEINQKLNPKINRAARRNWGEAPDGTSDHWGRFSMITFRGARLWHAYLGSLFEREINQKLNPKINRAAR